MASRETLNALLLEEIEATSAFDFVALVPSGRPLHAVEVTRTEQGALEVRVPGRPPMVPELAVERREALRSRGFTSDEPADRTQPWAHAVPDAPSAADLAHRVLEEVFGEKPDAKLDIAHGSHRGEHELRAKLAKARERIERVAREMLECDCEQDNDGDYVFPVGDVQVTVAARPAPGNRVLVRVFAITNVGIEVNPEVGLLLSRLNFGLMVGRFSLDADRGAVWFDETLLAENFDEGELRWTIELVASTADQWDDQLKRMFGGSTHQEIVTGRAAGGDGAIKPGGTGQYL